MFSDMIRYLPCNFCEKGRLMYNQRLTLEAWQHPDIFRMDDIGNLKDNIISDVLVMACNTCDAEVRYTLKEIEKQFRKNLSDRIFTMIVQGDAPDPGSVMKASRLYYYCGKCNGFDGKGACPKSIYDNCELKRMPYGF
jgi:hypothetical protein